MPQNLAEIETECAKRFAADGNVRRWFKCGNANPDSDEYKNALARYVKVEAKCQADNDPANRKAEIGDSRPDDPISNLMRNNKSIFETVP